MRLRSRLALAFTFVTAVALVVSFVVTYVLVQRDELREIDHALLVQADRVAIMALEENRENPRVADGNGEIVEPPSLTVRYAATYENDGRIASATRTFGGRPPRLETLGTRTDAAAGTAVDFDHQGVHLRGVLVPLGNRVLLYAVSRAGVDSDLAFLIRVFVGLFAASMVLTWVVAQLLARSLVRDVDAIYEVTEAVAAGKLDARVGGRAVGSVETRLLAERVDEMIGRLGELVASQRVFITSAAHELRSPLTSLRGELELALRRERSAAEYRETIERALDDSVTLATLADDLLAIARSEGRARMNAHSGEAITLSEVIEDATRMSRGNAESHRVKVEVVDHDAIAIPCSRKEVARALRNLLDNAITHTPIDGTVTLRTIAEEDRVDVAVEDQGPGVDPADAPLLFAPFWRGSRERQGEGGAGLGLALAREIARAEGGDVLFDPAFSGGARFVLRLPRSSWRRSERRVEIEADNT
jgi:two-component system heavy metal sensor histidine kinase CusS